MNALDEDGYLVIANLLDRQMLENLRNAFESGSGSQVQSGTRHVDLTQAEGIDVIRSHPRILELVRHVLQRPFRIQQIGGRDPLPGFGQQGLHSDWLPRGGKDPYSVVTTIWLLDDFTEINGATRVVPRSHLDPRPLPKSMQAPASHHPHETIVTGTAGSVLIFNGHLWHSGTRNDSQASRRAIQCQFVGE